MIMKSIFTKILFITTVVVYCSVKKTSSDRTGTLLTAPKRMHWTVSAVQGHIHLNKYSIDF